jgi:hypothetical protein
MHGRGCKTRFENVSIGEVFRQEYPAEVPTEVSTSNRVGTAQTTGEVPDSGSRSCLSAQRSWR